MGPTPTPSPTPSPAASPASTWPASAASLAALAASLPGFDGGDVPVALAQRFLLQLARPLQHSEQLALAAALGRVLAEDLISPIDVPQQDNSAMDGYALRGSDLASSGPTRLRVAGKLLAGATVPPLMTSRGQCLRIMTGASLPADLDTVVPQERVALDGDHIIIGAGAIWPGANRRRAGEDLARGKIALPAGRVLQAADLGLLASLGQASVVVRPRLRVACFSTGNELRPPGMPLTPGCLYDSNRYTVRPLIESLGFDLIDLGIIRDEPRALAAALREAASVADAIITSGGAGVGEADHTAAVFAEVGEAMFWSLALRPGRPFVVGRIRRPPGSSSGSAGSAGAGGDPGREPALLFGLPGNPVAAMVVFLILVRDTLLRMAGAQPRPIVRLPVPVGEPLRKRPGRSEYLRVRLIEDDDGQWRAWSTGSQGSGILSSMSEADGLLELGPERGDVAVGEMAAMLPLRGLTQAG